MVVEAQCDVDVVGGVNRQINSLVSKEVVLPLGVVLVLIC